MHLEGNTRELGVKQSTLTSLLTGSRTPAWYAGRSIVTTDGPS